MDLARKGAIAKIDPNLSPLRVSAVLAESRRLHVRHTVFSAKSRTPPDARHTSRHRAHRRLCLAARPQLAGGVQGFQRPRSGDPRPSRGGERLCEIRHGRHGAPAGDADRRDARAHQGRRFLRPLPRWRMGLWNRLRGGSRISEIHPPAARWRRGDRPARRREGRRRSALFFRRWCQPFGRPQAACLGL